MDYVPFDYSASETKLKLLSIHTCYVDAIRDGSKHFELRCYSPHVYPGDWCIVYETKPTMHLATAFRSAGFWCMNPEDAWQRHGGFFGIEPEAYFEYFRDRKHAYGIIIDSVVNFDPLSINELRDAIGFAPPQAVRGWTYNRIHKRILDAVENS